VTSEREKIEQLKNENVWKILRSLKVEDFNNVKLREKKILLREKVLDSLA
jgi:hypothetical protein